MDADQKGGSVEIGPCWAIEGEESQGGFPLMAREGAEANIEQRVPLIKSDKE